jgi:hypothetical protein
VQASKYPDYGSVAPLCVRLDTTFDLEYLEMKSCGNLFTASQPLVGRWSMRTIHVVLLVLILAGWACAQSDRDSTRCFQVVNGADFGCRNTDMCLDTTGCTAFDFVASCTGTYTVDVWTTCEGGLSCPNCRACALVYFNGQQVGTNCHAVNCGQGACEYTCLNTIPLTAGRTYTLYVCLDKCSGQRDCEYCDQTCIARACLRYGVQTTCY